MFRADSLVIYKNRPALVRDIRDRIEIRTEDGSSVKVRDKDLHMLHEGPVKAIPAPSGEGDFETARKMLAGDSDSPIQSSWSELAELVFGATAPSDIMACFEKAFEGHSFVLEEGLPWARGDADLLRETRKRERKASEASERENFILKAKSARKKGIFETEDSDRRFLSEIESLALGKSERCRIAVELGLQESPEAAHAFLLSCGYWENSTNPHPSRSACPLKAPAIPLLPESMGTTDRMDLTGFTSWAIDNEWSKDPDDALAWDGANIWIHVADPAAAILPDSPADREALLRGATLYLPELTSPMLPDEALVRYGLGLSSVSPALSFRVELDPEGYVRGVEVFASIVKVRRSHYGEADRLLAEGNPDLARMDEIAKLRTRRRRENGSVEISIPEVRVHVESSGEVFIHRPGSFRSAEIVREFMLLAGEAAAIWAFGKGLAFPFYSQEAPSISSDDDGDETRLSRQFSRRKGMRSGMLGPSPGAHRGLGLPFYAQTTSPLRRYQDLLGHMQIHAILEGRSPLDPDEVGRRCAMAQAAQAPNRQAERASESHWRLIWLSRHPEWTGEAILVSAAGQGQWLAYIPEIGLETKIRLPGEFRLDETVSVKVSRIVIPTQEIVFDASVIPKTD